MDKKYDPQVSMFMAELINAVADCPHVDQLAVRTTMQNHIKVMDLQMGAMDVTIDIRMRVRKDDNS